jgi:hypothetical protein
MGIGDDGSGNYIINPKGLTTMVRLSDGRSMFALEFTDGLLQRVTQL